MGQGGAYTREIEEQPNHRQRREQGQTLDMEVDGQFFAEGRYDSDDGYNEVDGIVVEELADELVANMDWGDRPEETHTVLMKTEADKVVLQIPNEDGETTDRCDQNRDIQPGVLELLAVE